MSRVAEVIPFSIFSAIIIHVWLIAIQVYIKLYNNHISNGLDLLGKIPPFVDNSDANKKATMVAHCMEVKQWAADTSEGMRRVLDEVGFQALFLCVFNELIDAPL